MTDKPIDVPGLWKSRKFRLLLLDTVVSIAIFGITHYLSPESQELALFLIGSLQPVFVTIIGGIAYEDGKEKGATVVNHHYGTLDDGFPE